METPEKQEIERNLRPSKMGSPRLGPARAINELVNEYAINEPMDELLINSLHITSICLLINQFNKKYIIDSSRCTHEEGAPRAHPWKGAQRHLCDTSAPQNAA